MKRLTTIVFFIIFTTVFFLLPNRVLVLSADPTPKLPPFPTVTIPETVPACVDNGSRDESVYPPNSTCYSETKRTQSDIKDYTKTCIKEPTVTYGDTRDVYGPYGYKNCFGSNSDPCNVYITVTTDISKAELGSYGPDYDVLKTSASSADTISKKYLFNSLFDRPYFIMENTPREAWRTYWRLLPFYEQANLTSQFINLVNLPENIDKTTLKKINNTKYQYVNSKGKVEETTVKKLAGSLPSCLKEMPVCKDFVKAYNEMGQETKDAYDTLIPLSFNNLRGFVAVSGTVSRESIPYVETIFSGLLSNKYGLIANLQPDWLFTKSNEKLTDTNTGYDLSTEKDGYLSGQWKGGKFGDAEMDSAVLSNADISSCPDFPNVYSVSAPRTFPKSPDNQKPNHVQEIKILGSSLSWSLEQQGADQSCVRWGYYYGTCLEYQYSCPSGSDICPDSPDQCCQYSVSGTGTGKALTVFNNPKTTDIKQAVISDQETSLYNSLVPMSLIKPTPTDKKIDAPLSDHAVTETKYSGDSTVNNPSNPIIRENNLAQDAIHVIQNCWLVPKDQQSSSKCGVDEKDIPPFICADCDPNIPDAATAMALRSTFVSLATRWLSIGNPAIDKFDTVVNSAVAAGVNPVFALAIWLNESDASNYEGVCKKLGNNNYSSGYCNHLLDFGVLLENIVSNYSTGEYHFNEQLTVFLGLPEYYKSVCASEMAASDCPMRVYMSMFSQGSCEPSTQSDGYSSGIQNVYSWLAPNLSFPCYPSKYP